MAEPFFYVNALADVGETVTLGAEESRHALGARRYRDGERLWLFDGRGGVAQARVRTSEGRQKQLDCIIDAIESQPPPSPGLHLACALPKGERSAVLVEMATQLGMTHFTPLACARGVAQASAVWRRRFERLCLEACKQSRRAHLPALNDPASPQAVTATAAVQGARAIFLHPGRSETKISALQAGAGTIVVLIGPEGGFDEAEIAAMREHGAKQLALGSAILRVEAAAVAVLAALRLAAIEATG